MTKSLTYLLLTTVLFSCTTPAKEQLEKDLAAWTQVRTSSEFVAYENFAVTYPSSVKFDSAMERYVYSRDLSWVNNPPPLGDCWSTCMRLSLHKNGSLETRDSAFPGSVLRKYTYKKLAGTDLNKLDRSVLMIFDSEGNERFLSAMKFKLAGEFESFALLRQTILRIDSGIQDYKNSLAMEWFGNSFGSLTNDQRTFIDSALGKRIFLEELKEIN